MTALFQELVEAAVTAERLDEVDIEKATYLLSALRTSLALAINLGNDFGVSLPDAVDLAFFCLGGLGISRSRAWLHTLNDRLDLNGDGQSILRRLARQPVPESKRPSGRQSRRPPLAT